MSMFCNFSSKMVFFISCCYIGCGFSDPSGLVALISRGPAISTEVSRLSGRLTSLIRLHCLGRVVFQIARTRWVNVIIDVDCSVILIVRNDGCLCPAVNAPAPRSEEELLPHLRSPIWILSFVADLNLRGITIRRCDEH